jgi:hypothetical protein
MVAWNRDLVCCAVIAVITLIIDVHIYPDAREPANN